MLLFMRMLPTLSIGQTELRRVNILSELLPEYDEKKIDVLPAPKPPKPMVAVTAKGKKTTFKEVWTKGVTPIIDFSEGRKGGMDHFYAALAGVRHSDRPVRIAYFGDSFIEGDIFSGDLRQLFQKTYGGYGVGWVDCANPINRNNRRTATQTFNGITEYTAVKKPFDRSLQGIAQRYYAVAEGAHVTTTGAAPQYHSLADRWDVARLFYKTLRGAQIQVTTDSMPATVINAGGASYVQMAETRAKSHTITYRFGHTGGRLTAFGMALESDRGVILDNYSLRGSQGVTLAAIPANTLAEFARLRPFDLIIIHFGLNVAVQGNTLPVMQLYVNNMKKVVNNFRAAFPEASILIMSVPDRDERTANGISTLKEVKNLVTLQERMAAECNVGFYNFYEAMGGQGSMKRLVDRRMANKDYTHLSYGGGKHVAQKIFPSFREGLNNYKRRKALEKQ